MVQGSRSLKLVFFVLQVLNEHPDLIPVILPRTWARLYSKTVQGNWAAASLSQSWPKQVLIDALRGLIHQNTIPLKICFLIDGLDELVGDHEELSRLFKEVIQSRNIKACLSSRPWVIFEQFFRKCPSSRLENLTYRDIETTQATNLI